MNVAEAVLTETVDNSTEDAVDFDDPNDPENPLNWSSVYKWSIVLVISIMSLVVWVCSLKD